MATKKKRKKARNLKLRVIPKVAVKPKALATPKPKPVPAAKPKAEARPKRKRAKRKALVPIRPMGKPARKPALSQARHKQLAFARKKKFERLVTEKTLRDILALRCVQRCTH
jgi:hypothetical protein